jgi:hypothetical protein
LLFLLSVRVCHWCERESMQWCCGKKFSSMASDTCNAWIHPLCVGPEQCVDCTADRLLMSLLPERLLFSMLQLSQASLSWAHATVSSWSLVYRMWFVLVSGMCRRLRLLNDANGR